jgi:hypothetical protein
VVVLDEPFANLTLGIQQVLRQLLEPTVRAHHRGDTR